MLVLFQGDSITDGGRGRTDDPNHILGHGYAYIVAARLGRDLAAESDVVHVPLRGGPSTHCRPGGGSAARRFRC